MTDPAQIAKRLSEGQKAAVQGRWAWNNIYEAEDGEDELFRLGIWSRYNLKKRKPAITDLGLAVRAELEKMA